MSLFHFTGQMNNATVTVSVEMANVMHAALEAGHQMRQIFAAQGVPAGYLTVERIESAPVVDEHAATRQMGREMGREMGLTEAQIDRFIARQA